jgi:predicted nucleotidyltransferase
MLVRIRDFVETFNDWIFSVADYAHPLGVRGLLRYVPDPFGERESNGRRYKKMDFEESYAYLRRNKPDYVSDLHVVPEADIVRLIRPNEELDRIAGEDDRVARIVRTLEDGGVRRDRMGVTGSMMLGLQGPSSDIDFVVYGKEWFKAREILSEAVAETKKHSWKKEGDRGISELDLPMWKRIYLKRKPDIPFDDFVLHERRKGNRGMIDGTYFDLLYTRDYDEISAPEQGQPVGRARLEAKIVDTEYSFDSPSILKASDCRIIESWSDTSANCMEFSFPIDEILCYSHTYAGQALDGEIVEAKGIVEKTKNGGRLVVGTTREARGEWIVSRTLLGMRGAKGFGQKEKNGQ